jgi:Zn-dependent peptidase ImmA (M78 family)
MSRVAVSKDILLWALSRSAQSVEDIAHVIPGLRDWINGEKHPTLGQLEKFAKSTHTPFGFMFLTRPPQEKLPIPHFRTIQGDRPLQPSGELIDTIYAMQLRQAWMRDELKEQGNERLEFVQSVQIEDPPKFVAEKMRGLLKFKEDWAEGERTWSGALRVLRETMEDSRILVVMNGVVGNNTHRKLNSDEFRGFVLVDEFAPLVFVNNADGKAAQMFTLAHELAHIVFGSSAAFDLRQMMPAQDRTELACNRAAAEFLVPERLIRLAWPEARKNPQPFQVLAHRFKVSEIVAARRALDLGLIGRETFFGFYKAYTAIERSKSEETPGGGNFYLNQNLRVGARFGAAVVRAVKEGRLGYTEAYRMTGLHGKTFEQYAALLTGKGI